jgi:lipoprotein-releasing system ATP-binding protein
LARFRGTNIGFIFQAHHLLPEFTALENVMMPALIQRVPTTEARKRALDLLESVGLSERTTHRPGQLSGGEQQRVALARSLIMQPKLLLADEPTGNLDSRTGEGVHRLFFDLNKKLGITILMVTHNRELARQIPRQLRMVDGLIPEENHARPPNVDPSSRETANDGGPAESSEVTG